MWYVAGEIALLLVLALLLGLLVGWLLWGRRRDDDVERVLPRPMARSHERTAVPRPVTSAERVSAADRRPTFDPPERPRATGAPVTNATGDDATVVILRGDGGLSAAPTANDDELANDDLSNDEDLSHDNPA